VKRLPLAVALAGVLLLATSAGASQRAATPGASARAFGIKVLVPGAAGGERVSVTAPPDTEGYSAGFAYGSDVTTGAISASVSARSTDNAEASAEAKISSLSLFGGEVTVGSIVAKAHGVTKGLRASGDTSGSGVSGITVGGQPAGSGRVQLGDWGYATTLAQASVPGRSGAAQSYRSYVTALDIRLTAAHGGLPAGTEILVGYAEASVQGAPPPPPAPKAKPKPRKPTKKQNKGKAQPKAPEPKTAKPSLPTPVQQIPYGLQPKLSAGGYVFPVYGPASFTDTFGAYRGDIAGHWHHGDDIFAPLGAPILACADGVVFSVGWNDVGGNRLWLRDNEGNQFYYAHLSAFSPLAVNGTRVKAGEVVGFVGNTGDATGTPYHLHFEVHPVSLLHLGYDGAVDPTPYLTAWQRLQDVSFTGVAGWLPSVTASSSAPKPGAILLQVSDISEANGLDPSSLRRAMSASLSLYGDGFAPKQRVPLKARTLAATRPG
jgi:murein DD-endopeptidase MepM/ murein hydrolase activator NlpD